MSTKSTPAVVEAPAKKNELYNINLVLAGDVEIKQAKTQNGDKPYALVKGTLKNGKSITVMTFTKSGIAVLEGKTAGTSLRLYGTYSKSDKGQTFSAMGLSPERPAKEVAPAM